MNDEIRIASRAGRVVSRSCNLRGIRRYRAIVDSVYVDRLFDGSGRLRIVWHDGATCETVFANYAVMCLWIHDWRNWQRTESATLYVDGVEQHPFARGHKCNTTVLLEESMR